MPLKAGDYVQTGQGTSLMGLEKLGSGFGGAAQARAIKAENLQLKQLGMQTDAMRQQLAMQKQLADMLLGIGGNIGGTAIGGGGGIPVPAGGGALPRFGQQGQTGGGLSITAGGGGSSGGIIDQLGAGRAAAIERGAQTAANNALGALEARGMGGSSLVAPALSAVEEGKQMSLGLLSDQILERRLDASERGADRQLSLLTALLGGAFRAL